MFTACNKESEVSETIQSEEPITTEDSLASTVADTTAEENIEDETDKATAGSTQSEPNASVTVDSAGSDIQLEEGDYIPVSPEEQKAQQETAKDNTEETVNASSSANIDFSQYDADTQKSLNNLKRMFDKGLLTEEDYLFMVEAQIHAAELDDQPAHIPAPDHVKAESTSNLPPNDTRTNITYDDVELPDHLKGSYIGN